MIVGFGIFVCLLIFNPANIMIPLTGKGRGYHYNLNKVAEQIHRYGPGQVIYPRLGQGTFRFAVEQAYQQCAVTKEHSIPALEAAHIKPYSLGGFHEVNNPKLFYLFFSFSLILHLTTIEDLNYYCRNQK